MRPKRGSRATEQGEGVGGGHPIPRYREIFKNSSKFHFVHIKCHDYKNVRGSGIDEFPTLFP